MLNSGDQIKIKAGNETINGVVTFNHTGNQKNLVMVKFAYNNTNYCYPFSRKTGKVYRVRLSFNPVLILK
jgi:hypothetical protein